MATEFVTLRDGSEQSRHLLPPGEISILDCTEALGVSARSFLVGPEQSVTLPDDGLLELLCPATAEVATDAWSFEANRLRFTLPPVEMRADGYKSRDEIVRNRIPTPLDERGLVDVSVLIQRVKETVKPEYGWPGYCDEHHVFWPAYRYGIYQTFKPEVETVSFRNLPANKIWVPRVFHNWLHVVTEPPSLPAEQVMAESIDEWVVVRDFFASIKDTTRTLRIYERERIRRRNIDNPLNEAQEDLLSMDIRRRLGGVIMHFRNLEGMGVGRWPISMNMGLHAAAGQVGDMVLRGHRRHTKDVRRLPESLRPAA